MFKFKFICFFYAQCERSPQIHARSALAQMRKTFDAPHRSSPVGLCAPCNLYRTRISEINPFRKIAEIISFERPLLSLINYLLVYAFCTLSLDINITLSLIPLTAVARENKRIRSKIAFHECSSPSINRRQTRV